MRENNTYFGHEEDKNLPDFYRSNPFSVPEDYFSTLSSQIRSHIRLDEIHNDKNNPFATPKDYFYDLKNAIQAEIKNFGDNKETGFTTPESYIESSREMILAQVKLQNIHHQNKNAFDVPANYFDQLNSKILDQVRQDKLVELPTSDGYAVPNNYFEDSRNTILSRVTEQDNTATVLNTKIPVRSINRYSHFIRYAAAACILFILAIGSYFYLDTNTATVSANNTELANIPDEDIANYLALSGGTEDQIYFSNLNDDAEDKVHKDHLHDENGICDKVKEQDIEDYLNYML